jgi:hypothetical protein
MKSCDTLVKIPLEPADSSVVELVLETVLNFAPAALAFCCGIITLYLGHRVLSNRLNSGVF